MACVGRVYKGEDLEVTIPFKVEGAEDIMVSLYTDGTYSIDKEGQVIDGEIVVEVTQSELDVLADGVLRYTVTYDVDGEEYSFTSNTPNYIKTPVGYSATSVEEFWESGYTQGEQVGFSNGYAQGVDDVRNQFVTLSATTNGLYLPQSEYAVFKEVLVNVPQSSGSTPCSASPMDVFNMACFDDQRCWCELGFNISWTSPFTLDFDLCYLYGGGTEKAIVFSTQNLDNDRPYIEVSVESSTVDVKFKDGLATRQLSTCSLPYADSIYDNMRVYYGHITLSYDENNLSLSDQSCSFLEGVYRNDDRNWGRKVVINGVWDGDLHRYVGMADNLYLNNIKYVQDGVLRHHFKWFNNDGGELYDIIEGRGIPQWHYDSDHEESWTPITGEYPFPTE